MAKVDNVLIHFLSEDDVTSMDLSIYKDREFVGKMSSACLFELPVEDDCELFFVVSGRGKSCWNNKVRIRKGIDNHVFLSFGGAFGGLKVYTSNIDNAEEIYQRIDRDSSNNRLYVILVVVFIIVLYLINVFII